MCGLQSRWNAWGERKRYYLRATERHFCGSIVFGGAPRCQLVPVVALPLTHSIHGTPQRSHASRTRAHAHTHTHTHAQPCNHASSRQVVNSVALQHRTVIDPTAGMCQHALAWNVAWRCLRVFHSQSHCDGIRSPGRESVLVVRRPLMYAVCVFFRWLRNGVGRCQRFYAGTGTAGHAQQTEESWVLWHTAARIGLLLVPCGRLRAHTHLYWRAMFNTERARACVCVCVCVCVCMADPRSPFRALLTETWDDICRVVAVSTSAARRGRTKGPVPPVALNTQGPPSVVRMPTVSLFACWRATFNLAKAR